MLELALLGTMKSFLLKNPPLRGTVAGSTRNQRGGRPPSPTPGISAFPSAPPPPGPVCPPRTGKGSRVNPPGRAAGCEGLSRPGLGPACLFPILRVLFNTEQAPGLQQPRRHVEAAGWKPAPGKQVPGAKKTRGGGVSLPPPAGLGWRRQVGRSVGRAVDVRGTLRAKRRARG